MMIVVEKDLCHGCGLCIEDCPLDAVKIVDKKAVINNQCVSCGICTRVCPFNALTKVIEIAGKLRCTSCPVQCTIPEGYWGACQRYQNIDGKLVRNRQLVVPLHEDLPRSMLREKLLSRPLITGVGSGTTYPCYRPAPFIIEDEIAGIEVVTVVTEAPLSYSGLKVKIDTNLFIGKEGAKVTRQGKVVGMVTTEEYGSKMLTLGGVNLLSGNSGFVVARTVVELANGQRVTLKVAGKTNLELQVGFPPIINGIKDEKMRIGCGSATIGMFAHHLQAVVDEAIILDHHVIGLLSEHLAGEEVGLKYSGVVPYGRKSTRGRYFGEHGHGWGGTKILDPKDAIKSIDLEIAKPGLKILVTETTGSMAALFTVLESGEVKQLEMLADVQKVVDLINTNCEPARVSAVYTGGTGGSARAGVTNYPLKLTEAIHNGDAQLTIGGASAFILPGGGINFMVDVEKVVPKAFSWVPTPATVAPIEYTLEKQKYEELGGHMEAIRPLKDVLQEISYDEIDL